MKNRIAAVSAVLFATISFAGDVEMAGMKSKFPDNWKQEEASSTMRLTQFKLPKAEGDPEDAQLIIFYFKGGSGSAEDNMKRQLAKFKPAEGKDKVDVKVEKIQVGKIEAPYQDITGTYLSKDRPFDPAAKVTEKKEYRQLYVPLTTDQ